MGQPLLRMSWMRAVCFWGFWRTHCQAVHLKSFKIKAILLNLESQYMSEHNPTLSLSLSYYQGIFSCLFNFKPFGQGVLWIWQKNCVWGGNREQESIPSFHADNQTTNQDEGKTMCPISYKNLPSIFWMTLFSNNLQNQKLNTTSKADYLRCLPSNVILQEEQGVNLPPRMVAELA